MSVGGFFVLAAAGIVAGFVYELGLFVRRLFKDNVAVSVVVDFVTAIIAGAIFVFVELKYLNFNIYGFGLASFVLGFVAERISLGFLLAKIFRAIYNVIVKLTNKFKTTKLGKISLR